MNRSFIDKLSLIFVLFTFSVSADETCPLLIHTDDYSYEEFQAHRNDFRSVEEFVEVFQPIKNEMENLIGDLPEGFNDSLYIVVAPGGELSLSVKQTPKNIWLDPDTIWFNKVDTLLKSAKMKVNDIHCLETRYSIDIEQDTLSHIVNKETVEFARSRESVQEGIDLRRRKLNWIYFLENQLNPFEGIIYVQFIIDEYGKIYDVAFFNPKDEPEFPPTEYDLITNEAFLKKIDRQIKKMKFRKIYRSGDVIKIKLPIAFVRDTVYRM